jgi:AraC family transcriptional regulator, positive regulator of tynA and feaB
MLSVERWGLADHAPSERADVWRDAVSRTHLPWELHTDRRTVYPSSNEIRRRSVGALSVIECFSGPCSGVRSTRQIAASDEDHIGVLFVLGGSEVVARDEAETVLSPGTVAFWDGTHRLRFTVPSAVRKRTLLIPRSRAAELGPRTDRLGGVVLPPSHATRVLIDLLASLLAGQPQEDGGAAEASSSAFSNAILELLSGAIAAAGPAHVSEVSTQRWMCVRDYIEDHLTDPQLDTAAIARSASISVRSLYLLFEARGETVSRYVKRRRLARARSELERPTDLTVAAVALRWGFNDHAAFSRAFRAQYGITPRDARAAAVHGPRLA